MRDHFLGVGKRACSLLVMEGRMGKIFPAMVVLAFALVSLVGYESRAGGETNLVRVAEMQKTLRELWLGHIFMIQHVVLYNTTNNQAERYTADKQVLANAKQIGVHGLEIDGTHVRFGVDNAHLDGAVRQLSELGLRSLISHPPTLEELFLRQYREEAQP